ncbi:MAG: hypothetical protein ACK5MT_07565 [Actinomycetales bacterium]
MCVSSMLVGLAQQAAVAQSSVFDETLDEVVAESAVDLRQQAIDVVDGMRYPDLDVTPPGKDFRKQEILLALTSSQDSLSVPGALLDDATALDFDVDAAHRLEQLSADPKVSTEAAGVADEALSLLVRANRQSVLDVVQMRGIFPEPYPASVAREVRRANDAMARGDAQRDKGHESAAIHQYVMAFEIGQGMLADLYEQFDPDGDLIPTAREELAGLNPDAADSD